MEGPGSWAPRSGIAFWVLKTKQKKMEPRPPRAPTAFGAFATCARDESLAPGVGAEGGRGPGVRCFPIFANFTN